MISASWKKSEQNTIIKDNFLDIRGAQGIFPITANHTSVDENVRRITFEVRSKRQNISRTVVLQKYLSTQNWRVCEMTIKSNTAWAINIKNFFANVKGVSSHLWRNLHWSLPQGWQNEIGLGTSFVYEEHSKKEVQYEPRNPDSIYLLRLRAFLPYHQ